MKRIIFYSWQSDLPADANRDLIDECLKRAIKAISEDEVAAVEPVLDRDTANIAGTPDIAQRILAKIAVADVFVADVSIVNVGAASRPAPNPNVLLELGYAIAELGWDNVLLVQNAAFGRPEQLPFDLRGRRVIVYEAAIGFNVAETRGLLQGRLEEGLRSALAAGSSGPLPTGRDAKLWWGQWAFGVHDAFGGNLFIREVGPEGFLFDLDVYSGAHSGALTAYARYVSRDLAYCRVPNGDNGQVGELVFRRRLEGRRRIVDVEETAPCSGYRGMRAHFGGTFERRYEPWFDAGFLNELDISRLYALTGQYLDKMRSCTSDIGEGDNLDEDISARVVWGGVPGLYTIMESILMLGARGELWCAFIDDEVVRYFTNCLEWKEKLPKTIEAWRSKFADQQVVYEDTVVSVPLRQA